VATRTLTGLFLLFAMAALWAVTTPKYASPDEPSHTVKAAATARGELIGDREFTATVPWTRFTVPATIAEGTNPACLAFTPTRPASCLAPWQEVQGLEQAKSYVGGYPPLYYLLVGLPSLATHGVDVLLWMRLVSALLSAIFLTGAFVCASRVLRGRGTVVGVALAMTPLAVFLAGVVNPSGLEISSALCFWTAGLALLAGHDPAHRRSLVVWTALSGATLVQLRGLSPLFVAVVTLILLAAFGLRPLLRLLRRVDMRLAVLAVGLCGAFAVSWIFGVGALHLAASGTPAPDGTWATLQKALSVATSVHRMIGVFGWLDTFMPAWCYVVWEVACVLLLVGVLLRRSVRQTLVLALLAVVAIGLPTALVFSQAHKLGIVGQSRDFLPILVGLPVLAAYICFRGVAPTRLVRSGVAVLAVALAAVQVTAFVQTLHRYRNGVSKPIFTSYAPWSPPIPWLLAIALFVVVQAGFVWWWCGLQRTDRPVQARTTAPELVGTDVTSPRQES
jgi:hypothetical protein